MSYVSHLFSRHLIELDVVLVGEFDLLQICRGVVVSFSICKKKLVSGQNHDPA